MNKITLTIAATAIFSAAAWSAETPPWTLSPTVETADQWETIDANKDGGSNQFVFDANDGDPYFKYTENKSKAADDWVISPAVTVQAGKAYKVTVKMRNSSTYISDKQDFTVTYGNAQTAAAQSNDIFSTTGVTKSDLWVTKDGKFTAAEDGVIYLGFHLTSKSYQGNCLFKSFEIEEVQTLPTQPTQMVATAGADGAMTATITWKYPTLNSEGGSLSGPLGAKIYRVTGLASSSDDNFIGQTEMSAEPGSDGSYTDTSITEPGKYKYIVLAYDATGTTKATGNGTSMIWIGPDTAAGNVTNLTATVVGGNVELSWTAPATGTNNGYLPPAELGYRISRVKDGGTSVTLEENWKGALPYVDENLDGLGAYKYTVATVYREQTSFGITSPEVIGGGTASLPYENPLNSQADIKFFSLFNATTPVGSSSTRNWGISSNALNYWGRGEPVNAWAVTPAFHFEAGKAYQITFDTWTKNHGDETRLLNVRLASEPTIEGLGESLMQEAIPDDVTSMNKKSVSLSFSVQTTGDYFVAFGITGNVTNTNDIYVDDLTITSITSAPAAPENLAVAADADGALKATLTWTNPTKLNTGADLTAISKAEIKRGEEVIATLTDGLVPGQTSTYVDESVPTAGKYTYSVTLYEGEDAGTPASVESPWIGFDTPAAPAGVTAALADNGILVSFDAVTTTLNGGIINAEGIKYNVMRNGELIAENIDATTYTDTAELPLAKYTYSVAAVNGNAVSAYTAAEPIIAGDALDLPYTPSFETKDDSELWTLGNWSWYKSDKALNTSSQKWAFTPRINMSQGTVQLTAAIAYDSYADRNDVIEFALCKAADQTDPQIVGETASFSPESSIATDVTANFQVPENGVYYVGMHLTEVAGYMGVNVSRFDLEQTSVTGLRDIAADGSIRYNGTDGTITVAGEGRLTIHNMNGVKVADRIVNGIMNVSNLPAGAYIVTFGGRTLKFMK